MAIPGSRIEGLNWGWSGLLRAQRVAPAEAQQRGNAPGTSDSRAGDEEGVGDPVLGLVVGIRWCVEEGWRVAEGCERTVNIFMHRHYVVGGDLCAGCQVAVGDDLYPPHVAAIALTSVCDRRVADGVALGQCEVE